MNAIEKLENERKRKKEKEKKKEKEMTKKDKSWDMAINRTRRWEMYKLPLTYRHFGQSCSAEKFICVNSSDVGAEMTVTRSQFTSMTFLAI